MELLESVIEYANSFQNGSNTADWASKASFSEKTGKFKPLSYYMDIKQTMANRNVKVTWMQRSC